MHPQSPPRPVMNNIEPMLAIVKDSMFMDNDPRHNELCWIQTYDDKGFIDVEFINPVIHMYGLFNYLISYYSTDSIVGDNDIDYVMGRAIIYRSELFHILTPTEIVKWKLSNE
jgi:hypothetical protein